jgi:hypothetical protein
MRVIHAGKPNRIAGKSKIGATLVLLFLLTGCAFDIQDWEPKDDKLHYAAQQCRTEMLLRDPLLGPLWYLSKDFKPCMEGTGHFKK